jgi:hypothetical protein
MYRALSLLIFLLVPALVLGGCAEPQPDPDTAPPDALGVEDDEHQPRDRLSDDEKLMLIDRLPIGSSYDDVRDVFPSVGPEEPAGTGLTETLSTASVPVRVMEEDAVLELNFDDGVLYSYYFQVHDADCGEAEALRAELRQYYQARFGDSVYESEEEPGYTMESDFWHLPNHDAALAMTLGRQADVCRLAWGYQIEYGTVTN